MVTKSFHGGPPVDFLQPLSLCRFDYMLHVHAACRRVYSYSCLLNAPIVNYFYCMNILFCLDLLAVPQIGAVKMFNFTRITNVEIGVVILQKLPPLACPLVLQSLSTPHQRLPTVCSDPWRARDAGAEMALQ